MFRRCSRLLLVLLLASGPLLSQELFPLNEPASNVPKGVLGLRALDESFMDISQMRNLFGLRVMYGLLPRLSIYATASVSNHHSRDFPANLVSHTHNGSQTTYSTGTFQRGQVYPYLFTGIYLYAKYRFLSIDGEHRHFRMAAYGEWSNVKVAHDETEPNLLDDTKGYGGGLIATYLKNHLAVSLTSGVIIPGAYRGLSPDLYGGPMVPTEVRYGRAVKYNLSFGYLLFPHQYRDYDQGNINVYVEFLGKAYESASVYQYGVKPVPVSTPLLKAGNYVDIAPGIQYIHKSNLRIEFSAELPMINQSYAHYYPMVQLGIQRYFYFHKK